MHGKRLLPARRECDGPATYSARSSREGVFQATEAVGPAGSVTGIDLAPDMIHVARATPAPAEPPIDWHIGDAAALPFPDDTYDAVLCQMGLMFIAERPAAIAEMRRTLV